MYVVDAIRKAPYRDAFTGDYIWHPPYPKTKLRDAPVFPGPEGHFDYLQPGTRRFSAAAVYASVRCVLEIWEHFLGRRLPLVRERGQRKLEIIPQVTAVGDTAWSGEGFLEFGFAHRDPPQPYCENLDVVAHEVGHIILKRVIGAAPEGRLEFERRSHDEAGADLVSLVSILHFDRVIAAVLDQTRGKLFSVNILSQIGEYRLGQSGRRASRLTFHHRTMRSAPPSTSSSRSTRPISSGVGSSRGTSPTARQRLPPRRSPRFAGGLPRASRRTPTALQTRCATPPRTSRGCSPGRGGSLAAPASRSRGWPRTSSPPTCP